MWQDCEGMSDCWGKNKLLLIWLFIVFLVFLLTPIIRKYNRGGGHHGGGFHGDGDGGGGNGGE